jgi:hypothetical protein
MEPTFSEFSYGYAVTEELMNGALGRMIGRPMFPTQREEGRAGGGYDVKMLPKVGVPLFLQFKRSDYLKRAYSKYWYLFNDYYYRIAVMRSKFSIQQELLIHLEMLGNDVYYIAPEFYTDDELTDYYTNKTVFSHSALFSPVDIGHLPDDSQHYIVFNHDPAGYFCSEKPRQLNKVIKGYEFTELYSKTVETRSKKIDSEFFDELIERTLGFLERSKIKTDYIRQISDISRKSDSLGEKARFASFLTRAYFDVELFIVGKPA